MAWPVGVTTRQVSFGPAVIIEDGTPLDMQVDITASRRLVWLATGSPMVPGGTTILTGDQEEHFIDLPITDQTGYGDGAGNAIDVSAGKQSHYYKAVITYLRGDKVVSSVEIAAFALPLGDGSPVDIDNLMPADPDGGATIVLPDAWTQAVLDAEAAAQNAANAAATRVGPELVINPGFENGVLAPHYSGGAAPGGNSPVVQSVRRTGAYGLRMTLTGQPEDDPLLGVNGIWSDPTNQTRVAVGETYQFSFWARGTNGDPTFELAAYMQVRDSTCTVNLAGSGLVFQFVTGTTVWKQFTTTITVPDVLDASYVVPIIYVRSSTAGQYVYIDDMSLRKMVTGQDIKDGAVTSAKILDGTITVTDIAASAKDAATGTASLRTLGSGAQQAMPGNRPLNQVPLPVGDVNMNNFRVVGVADPTSSGNAATKGYVDTSINSAVPPGVMFEYGGDTAPAGFLLADGSDVSRTTYAGLFGVYGIKYGAGDGSTTFGLPDRRKRVAVGLDATDTDFDTLGKTGGEKTHVLTINEMPSHDHPWTYRTGTVGTFTSNDGIQPVRADQPGGSYPAGNGAIGESGGGAAHNNLQPYIVMNYIIKT